MCWSMKVTATVASNLVTRFWAELSDVFYKVLLSWWISQPPNNITNANIAELENVPWFRNVNRKVAETILKESKTNGDFIIRLSSNSDNICSLSVCQDEEVYHINVRRRFDGFLSLGKSKPNENCFGSIQEIVECYMHEKLLINSSGKRVHTILINTNIKDIL